MIQPWPNIVEFYRRLPAPDIDPYWQAAAEIGRLAAHIADTRLSSALFGWTSMYELCICQTEHIEYPDTGPFLKITPLHSSDVAFRYVDTMTKSQQWYREVPGADAIPRLHRFLGQLRWVGWPLTEA